MRTPTIRRLGLAAVLAAALVLPACGGDGADAQDQTASEDSGHTGADGAGASESGTADGGADHGNKGSDGGNGGGQERGKDTSDSGHKGHQRGGGQQQAASNGDNGGSGELSQAMLTERELPQGVQIRPIDADKMHHMMQGSAANAQSVHYTPKECGPDNVSDPLSASGSHAQVQSVTAGQHVMATAVFDNTSEADLSKLEETMRTCSTVTAKGTMGQAKVDTKTTNELVDPPKLDADKAVAVKSVVTNQGRSSAPMVGVYAVEGDRGVYLAGSDSGKLDVNAYAGKAIDKLNSAE